MVDAGYQGDARTALFFDTETTGLPVAWEGPESPRQPKLVQLAFILADIGGEQRASVSMMITPDGWQIPPAAAAVHGITTEVARSYGVPLRVAMSCFAHHLLQAQLLVAHNIEFDLLMMKAAFCQMGRPGSMDRLDSFDKYCTQAASTDIVQCPPTERMKAAGRDHFKSPRLEEAYAFFTGERLDGAHDALVDVRGCRRVFEALATWSGQPGVGMAPKA